MAKGKFSQPRARNTEQNRDTANSRPTKAARPSIAQNTVAKKTGKSAVNLPSSQVFPNAEEYTETDDFELFQDAFEQARTEKRQAYRTGTELRDQEIVPKAKTKKEKKRKTAPLLIILCLLAIILLGGIAALTLSSTAGSLNIDIGSPLDPYQNKILTNVSISGVDVSGMTKSEAVSAVKNSISSMYSKSDIVISFPDQDIHLTPEKTGITLDVIAAVEEAFRYGRTGTKEEKAATYEKSLTEKNDIDILPYLAFNEEYVRSTIAVCADGYKAQFTQSGYELDGNMPALDAAGYKEDAPCQTLLLHIGTPGYALDTENLYNRIVEAYRQRLFHIKIDSLEYSETPAAIDIAEVYEALYIAPVDAAVDRQTFQITPESYGYKFSKKKATALLEEAKYGDTIEVPMAYAKPKVIGEEAYFQDVLGSCETPHTDNEKRNTNLRLACAELDGYIIKPGETISYNEILGERTKEKGYQPAPAYSGTDVVDSIGGGICQGSSTLYYCALLADLEIVERVNHGFVSNYIDYGMDATVSWGYPDLKIKNNFNCPIKITAEVSDGKMKIKLLGTDEKDYYVKMEYVVTGTEKPNTVYEEHGPNEGYKDGQVLKNGTTGIFVNTYKLKYDKNTDELLSKDKEARSIYKTVDKVVVKIVKNSSDKSDSDSSEKTSKKKNTTSNSGGLDVQPMDD